jgi:hypothetical protein
MVNGAILWTRALPNFIKKLARFSEQGISGFLCLSSTKTMFYPFARNGLVTRFSRLPSGSPWDCTRCAVLGATGINGNDAGWVPLFLVNQAFQASSFAIDATVITTNVVTNVDSIDSRTRAG